jgi:hypothetical protein
VGAHHNLRGRPIVVGWPNGGGGHGGSTGRAVVDDDWVVPGRARQ